MNRFPREVGQSTSNYSSSAGTAKDTDLELDSFPKGRGADPVLGPSMRGITKTRKAFSTMLMLRFLGAILVMGYDIECPLFFKFRDSI